MKGIPIIRTSFSSNRHSSKDSLNSSVFANSDRTRGLGHVAGAIASIASPAASRRLQNRKKLGGEDLVVLPRLDLRTEDDALSQIGNPWYEIFCFEFLKFLFFLILELNLNSLKKFK